MWISKAKLSHIKSFEDSGEISFSKNLNVLTGINNSGKSAVLRALYLLQDGGSLKPNDVRIGHDSAELNLTISDLSEGYLLKHSKDIFVGDEARIKFSTTGGAWNGQVLDAKGRAAQFNPFPQQEPENFIYPILSKRKVVEFSDQVNKSSTVSVRENFSNLVSKIDSISRPTDPKYDEYDKFCKEIIGFTVATAMTSGGKGAGYVIDSNKYIPLEAMGEGLPNLVAIIASLVLAERKLFLIEEPENDIHPGALKGILRLIIKRSKVNQFIITTHSNIVTKYLGSEAGAKIHNISVKRVKGLFTSKYEIVDDTPESRRRVLEDMGYELMDYDISKGWIFLEESSAQTIIETYLIKWFAKKLDGAIKILSCDGVSKVSPKFEDINRLFLFTHLEPMYKNRAWVLVDGDGVGKAAVATLKAAYTPSGWKEENFRSFSKTDFELYYPPQFLREARSAISIQGREEKRKAKAELLKKVLKWVEEDEKRAKKEFQESASEVIEILSEIESKI